MDVYVTSGSHLRGRCLDISVEGIKAELDRHIPVGKTVRVELTIDGNPLAIDARLAYHRQKQCGLVFQFDSDRQRRSVDKLLQAVQKIT